MNKDDAKVILDKLYLKLPEAKKFKFRFSLENNGIRVEGNGYDSVIDIENKSTECLLSELIILVRNLIDDYKTKRC